MDSVLPRSTAPGRLEIDERGSIVAVGSAVAAVLGEPPEALIGRRLVAVLQPSEQNTAEVGVPDSNVAVAGTTGDSSTDGALSRADGIAVVAAVGHELRSPLTSIRGYTTLLLNRWDRLADSDKTTMLSQIRHDAERVTRLINELLDISRLSTGQLTLAQVPVDLGLLVERVVASVGLAYRELAVEVSWPDGCPSVSADADKVEQVLTNLLENAAKYGNGLDTGVEGRVVEGGRAVAVTVRDGGPGVPTEDLGRIFDRGYQKQSGRPTGTGLGLWIARGLVEAHGGTLTVTSAPNAGAAFTFTLPTIQV